MPTRVLRVATAAVTAVLLALVGLGGGQAAAHTSLQSSTPTDGELLGEPPQMITLTFTEAVQPRFSQVAVTGPNSQPVTTGSATFDGPTVRQSVNVGAAGAYVVAYRVISADGHPVSGQLTYTLTRADPGANAGAAQPRSSASHLPGPVAAVPSSAADRDGGGHPWWPASILAVVLVAVALWPLLRRR